MGTLAGRFEGLRAAVVFGAALASMSHHAHASRHCPQPIAEIVSTFGTVQFRPAAADDWRGVDLDLLICPEDQIRTGAASRAAIVFRGTDTVLRIDQNTELKVGTPPDQERSLLDLLTGSVHFFSRAPRALEVQTPFVNAGVEGTEFFIGIAQDRAFIIVFEGRVRARNELGTVFLTDNQAAEAAAGQAPALRVVVRPRDAVQWTLFYPPVFADPTSPALSALLTRAARLLAAGQLEEASIALDAAPETGDVLALRAVIAVARNERERALDFGRRAVETSPRSAAARIALSYAQQASFDLEAARDTLVEATEQQPDDALAWARLAELWLSLGYLDRALEAAERAASLAPGLSRTNTVLGFAFLAQIRTAKAKAAFERAIELDSQDPLARLGLGLARIRDGDLTEGRQDIEIAAALDPGSSIIRSYLGKAYFEEGSDIFSIRSVSEIFDERRYDQAAKQLEIAKRLDPLDPTPWFYDAILKQSQNRPVEALQDLQKSIELNDNRAIYRSRLALDKDLAARGVSVATIYDDLGFDHLAVVGATKSLSLNPSNHSAHRFLSDAYARLPRREIARVSELLQAQLLQPLNINPVQPSLPFIDRNVITGIGPAEGAFNEFHPLFERNQAQLIASGTVGNQATIGGELAVSALWNSLSLSVGRSHIETDGFRANNDQRDNVTNLFAQWAVSPKLSVQAEYRRRDTAQGDLNLNFDPDDFFRADRRDIQDDVARVGARISAVPESTLILSGIYGDLTEQFVFVDEFFGSVFTTDERLKETGYQIELQHILEKVQYNLIAGLGTLSTESDSTATSFVDGILADFSASEFEREYYNGYLYGDFLFPKEIRWTVGASYVNFEQSQRDIENFGPKFGVEWDVIDAVRLRGAFFKTVKRPFVVGQTIEPTQVAGFNQLFDDTNGTRSTLFGLGIDTKLTERLFSGFEISRREIDFPFGPVIEKRREDFLRAYLNWLISDRWAFTLDPSYEQYENKNPFEFNVDTPLDLKTFILPVSIRYFAPWGFFAQLQTTYLHQDLERGMLASLRDGEENVFLLDAAIGFRLPNRRGILSLEIQNTLDQRFFYQDDSFRSVDVTRTSRFIPERRILLRATIRF